MSKKEEGRKYFVKTQAQCQKKGKYLKPFYSWLHRSNEPLLWELERGCSTGHPAVRGIVVLHPTTPSPTPGANVAKTDNDSTRGHRIGLLGQTISIIRCSVDLIFLRVQCKQAPSHDVFVYWWAFGGFPCAQLFACRAGGRLWCRRSRSHPWFGKILWRRKWQPTPVFLPGESHGRGAGRL